MASRFLMVRPNHSITSAYTLGLYISTVAGRLRIIGDSDVGWMTSITASQISTANSGSVPVKLSGEYSYRTAVPLSWASYFLHSAAALTAMSTIPALSRPNTTRRCNSDTEL